MKMDNTPGCILWLGFPYDSNIHHRARNAGKAVAPWHTLILSLRTMSTLVLHPHANLRFTESIKVPWPSRQDQQNERGNVESKCSPLDSKWFADF
jgi:hypothetical protein